MRNISLLLLASISLLSMTEELSCATRGSTVARSVATRAPEKPLSNTYNNTASSKAVEKPNTYSNTALGSTYNSYNTPPKTTTTTQYSSMDKLASGYNSYNSTAPKTTTTTQYQSPSKPVESTLQSSYASKPTELQQSQNASSMNPADQLKDYAPQYNQSVNKLENSGYPQNTSLSQNASSMNPADQLKDYAPQYNQSVNKLENSGYPQNTSLSQNASSMNPADQLKDYAPQYNQSGWQGEWKNQYTQPGAAKQELVGPNGQNAMYNNFHDNQHTSYSEANYQGYSGYPAHTNEFQYGQYGQNEQNGQYGQYHNSYENMSGYKDNGHYGFAGQEFKPSNEYANAGNKSFGWRTQLDSVQTPQQHIEDFINTGIPHGSVNSRDLELSVNQIAGPMANQEMMRLGKFENLKTVSFIDAQGATQKLHIYSKKGMSTLITEEQVNTLKQAKDAAGLDKNNKSKFFGKLLSGDVGAKQVVEYAQQCKDVAVKITAQQLVKTSGMSEEQATSFVNDQIGKSKGKWDAYTSNLKKVIVDGISKTMQTNPNSGTAKVAKMAMKYYDGISNLLPPATKNLIDKLAGKNSSQNGGIGTAPAA